MLSICMVSTKIKSSITVNTYHCYYHYPPNVYTACPFILLNSELMFETGEELHHVVHNWQGQETFFFSQGEIPTSEPSDTGMEAQVVFEKGNLNGGCK